MKSRYVYKGGEVIYAEEGGEVVVNQLDQSGSADYYVMSDIQPYQSMIDGTQITSRSQHREHLKSNGCIEIGNEVKHMMTPARLSSARPQLIEAVQRAKEQYGTRNVERAITSALQRAHEMQKNRR